MQTLSDFIYRLGFFDRCFRRWEVRIHDNVVYFGYLDIMRGGFLNPIYDRLSKYLDKEIIVDEENRIIYIQEDQL